MNDNHDPTEAARRFIIAAGVPARDCERASERWTTDEMSERFEVHAFLAPFVIVTRKCDGKKGTLEFTHHPRWYFNFVED